MDSTVTSPLSQRFGLFVLRVSAAGLIFWWGLARGLGTGTGPGVSDKYYGGIFTIDALLIAFGWFQVVLAVLVALGPWRRLTLPVLFFMNAVTALVVSRSIIDPFWLWMGGEKPDTVNTLFYPSLVVVAACWVLMAFRKQDRWAIGPH